MVFGRQAEGERMIIPFGVILFLVLVKLKDKIICAILLLYHILRHGSV